MSPLLYITIHQLSWVYKRRSLDHATLSQTKKFEPLKMLLIFLETCSELPRPHVNKLKIVVTQAN